MCAWAMAGAKKKIKHFFAWRIVVGACARERREGLSVAPRTMTRKTSRHATTPTPRARSSATVLTRGRRRAWTSGLMPGPPLLRWDTVFDRTFDLRQPGTDCRISNRPGSVRGYLARPRHGRIVAPSFTKREPLPSDARLFTLYGRCIRVFRFGPIGERPDAPLLRGAQKRIFVMAITSFR
jgi:hypothetical protein